MISWCFLYKYFLLHQLIKVWASPLRKILQLEVKGELRKGFLLWKQQSLECSHLKKKLKHLKYFSEEESDIAPVNKNYQDRSPLSDSIIIRCWIHSRHKLLITKSGAARGGSNAQRGVPHKCTSTAHLGVKTSSAHLFVMARPV